jgi:class 3 adenylate cyclase
MSPLQEPRAAPIEKYLNLRPGSFDHIPHYARASAIDAIRSVMRLERKNIFREGLYYIVLCDLCRSSEGAAKLGQELNKDRIETFILTCIEALAHFEPRNYFLPVREIGDAVLILFASFEDALAWWREMNGNLAFRNYMWEHDIPRSLRRTFRCEAKTVVHTGEVAYSDQNIPVAQAVNEVFKIEKMFKANELGITEPVRISAAPILREHGLQPKSRGTAILPGSRVKTRLFVIDKYRVPKAKKKDQPNDAANRALL